MGTAQQGFACGGQPHAFGCPVEQAHSCLFLHLLQLQRDSRARKSKDFRSFGNPARIGDGNKRTEMADGQVSHLKKVRFIY